MKNAHPRPDAPAGQANSTAFWHFENPGVFDCRFFPLLLPLFLLTANGLFSQTFWDGSESTDWADAANWSDGVPTATGFASIPGSMPHNPTLATTAFATDVYVESGAILTIAQAGVLNINGSPSTQGLWNQGTLENSGTLNIGAVTTNSYYGIANYGPINNHASGQINIDRATFASIYIFSGTITNDGAITIGGTEASTGYYGIANTGTGTFDNNSSGQITVDRQPGFFGISSDGIFTNAGTITLGETETPGGYGIYNNGTFDNETGGEIQIDKTTEIGIYNASISVFTNHASILIGANSNVGSFGIDNRGTFDNLAEEITIDRTDYYGIYNENFGTFNNSATIRLGDEESPGENGIYNEAVFNNNTGGQITIDRSTGNGIYNENTYYSQAVFTNAATINIGSTAPAGYTGLNNRAVFNNLAGGEITLDNLLGTGIFNGADNYAPVIFNNEATITMGGVENIGEGIDNRSTFNNNPGGAINIESATFRGIFNPGGTITNWAELNIGENFSPGIAAISNGGVIENKACATLAISAKLLNYTTFVNAGYFQVNTLAEHTNYGLTNNGIIEYPLGNPISGVSNNEITIAPITGSCSGFSNALGLGGTVDFDIAATWFLDENLTMPAGAFDETANTFTPTNLTNGVPTTVYFSINDNAGGCSRTVSVLATWTCEPDVDGDGYTVAQGDCDDNLATGGAINPGAAETPGDETDQNCDGTETCYLDADNDGYRPDASAAILSDDLDCTDDYEAAGTEPDTDCDDNNGYAFPEATEICSDGIDQDCSGADLAGITAITLEAASFCNVGITIPSLSGGTGPFSYSKNGGAAYGPDNFFLGLTGGQTYSVWAKDANGCTKSGEFTTQANYTFAGSKTNPTCNGGNDGTASILHSGEGYGPVTFELKNGPSVVASGTLTMGVSVLVPDLPAGNYRFFLEDASGCKKTELVALLAPMPLATSISKTNVACRGESTGTATVTATGGTGAKAYLWSSGGQTAQTATGLPAGTHSVLVEDANGCQKTAATTITQPAAALTLSMASTHPKCTGMSNGTAKVSATGGVGTKTYGWNPGGQTTAAISGLSAGPYTVSVSDGNGCMKTATATLTDPAPVQISNITSDFGSLAGKHNVLITASGGTAPLKYRRSNGPTSYTGAQISSTFANLAPATYHFVAVDKNLCAVTVFSQIVPVPVFRPAGGDAAGENVFSQQTLENQSFELAPNPARAFVNVVFPGSAENGILELTDGRGSLLQQFSVENLLSGGNRISLEGLASGVYFLHLRSEAGARATKRLVVAGQ